jgi:hypothetical protein
MDLATLLRVSILGSLIVPSIVVAIGSLRPAPRSRYAAALAWGCAWVGQLVVPMGLVAVACVGMALNSIEGGYLLTAFVTGPVLGALAIFVASTTGRCGLLTWMLLRGRSIEVQRRCGALLRHGIIGAVAALVGLAAWGLPFPGRWDSLFVMVGISLPTLACATVALAQLALVRWVVGER